MKVVLAGGAGFIGSHLTDLLLLHGHEVVVIDNLSTGRKENVHEDAELIVADISGPGRDLPFIPDVIVHLASPASPVDYWAKPLATMAANSVGTLNLLEQASVDDARFIFASTSEVYGDPLVHPQPESYFGNVDPIGPRSCYDESKRFGEALVTNYRQVFGVRAAIVRIFNTYGPRMRKEDGRVVPELMGQAIAGGPLTIHGTGQQTRSFCYVSDLVEGLRLVIEDEELDGQVLNLGSEEEYTIALLARHIAAATGSRASLQNVVGRDGDPQQRRPDISRIKQRYGWSPTVPLAEGLLQTLNWWRRS